MAEDIAIQVSGVSKSFKLPHEKQSSLKGMFINAFRGKRTYERQDVLKNIYFEIKKGEFFGIVGRNGSGKSTLLKLLAGIYTPDKGHIQINGKLTPFIELGVGFNPELTGRENVFLNGALLGFNRKEMNELYDEIVEFAELHKFMDQKLKNYSSGMQVRLAFSIAIRAQSDILLLDEVLAVGDALFQKKCYDYFKKLKKEKKTVVFVSHDSNALLEYCDKGILIEKGSVIYEGKIERVVNQYIDILNEQEESESSAVSQDNSKNRWGTGEVVVDDIQSFDSSNKPKKVFNDDDDTISIEVMYESKSKISNPIYGITITDPSGQRLFTSNTLWSKMETKNLDEGTRTLVRWIIPNVFNTGSIIIAPAVAGNHGSTTYDWVEDALVLKIRKKITSNSYINVDHQITLHQESSVLPRGKSK